MPPRYIGEGNQLTAENGILTVTVTGSPEAAVAGSGLTAVLPPPAISNAVFDAIGVRLRSVPFTPERVKKA